MTEEQIQEKAEAIIMQIDNSIKEYHGAADPEDITPSRWSAGLMYTGRKLFPRGSLALRNTEAPKVFENYKYNYKLLLYICDYYIFICKQYNQICSVYNFEYLINIDYGLINSWTDRTSPEASPEAAAIVEKIDKAHEASLCEVGLYGKHKNPVGYIAALNHFYRWNDPGNGPQISAKQTQDIDALPDFSTYKKPLQELPEQ